MGKEKKTINVLIDFFISHKSDVKTFFVLMFDGFDSLFDQCVKGELDDLGFD